MVGRIRAGGIAGILLGWLALVPLWASAATVVGVVSERSAAELAAGAHAFVDQHPDHKVMLRTPVQLASLTDPQLEQLLAGADALLLAAVFGDQVERLERGVRARIGQRPLPVLAINSDRRLVRLSYLDEQWPLANLGKAELDAVVAAPEANVAALDHLRQQQTGFPDQARWLQGRAYYQGRTPEHLANLMAWMLVQAGQPLAVPAPSPRAAIRYYRNGQTTELADALGLTDGPVVALLDLDSGDRPGDRALLDQLCWQLEQRHIQCFAILARWGGASAQALASLPSSVGSASLAGLVSLQDFVIGGGEGRETVTEALAGLNVPVIKGLRLSDLTESQWRLSVDGLPADSVHYQLAMPELQGVSQPMALAVARPPLIDERTGVRLTLTTPVPERVSALVERLHRWQRLQAQDNADKRVALIYYNHPPGRQNIGADSLDVPASLWEMLHWLQAEGYQTGPLPASPQALLELIQQRGISLPDDPRALREMAPQVASMDANSYQAYFQTLPAVVQAEMVSGPVGYLHERLHQAFVAGEHDIALALLDRGIRDLRHLLENLNHPARPLAVERLDDYHSQWLERLNEGGGRAEVDGARDDLLASGFPGLSGWGPAPGRSMVVDNDLIFPGLRFGNVFLGPQPPRGWEVDEELLHANTTFPPTHQYVAFYYWLRSQFDADALVYVGRHSTREFLPRRRAALTEDDYPELLSGNLPLLYPYIVDGVGEGIQAKRRALAVMISHLTPPLAATELYDELLEIRQLVETYEASVAPNSPTRRRAVELLRQKIRQLNLTETIEQTIASEAGLAADAVSLDTISEDLLVHEAGHYVTDVQEQFMPLGLHVLGRDWDTDAIDTMLASMAGETGVVPEHWRAQLTASPAAEKAALLAGLSGRFVEPGEGNDPLRTPAVLPTGRNFHALSGDLIPTRVAWSLAEELATEARRQDRAEDDGSDALVLWASDTVRDEGVMVAFGLQLLGIRPVWNSRGIVKGLERLPVGPEQAYSERRDVLFTTSGLFRDLYGNQLEWLDQAVLLALAGSADTIVALHPELDAALTAVLSTLPEGMAERGSEPLAVNRVAARWLADTRQLLASGVSAAEAGGLASLRVFGTAPGAYGAGVNRLATRTGAWNSRDELADAYRRRMGHAYGSRRQGEAEHRMFDLLLARVDRTYLGRASHLYGLIDNDDGFDYQGGLSNAVERVRGQPPENRVLQYANPDNPRVQSLQRALLQELQSRNLNPQWIRPLMDHDYAGARTMGSDFLDNLWGWQITSPQVVKSWVWDEVNQVYFQDRHNIGLDDFLSEGNNVHVKTHMQATALLAAKRGYWETSWLTLEPLVEDFAQNVIDHGLPGDGHTRPDHPLMDWVSGQLDPAQREAFDNARKGGAPLDSLPLQSRLCRQTGIQLELCQN
ncbi:cobaltochelatase subunit CobN [Marinobacter mobilis]|uniref:Cobaltochelatase CobN n=1 Tax=Marinobacter mobilis TaxID=488533 RepID=A0A1H3C395_9GAMM|nr:cobaltochelatase subunit CobN [Marinobacter mobilis]SDX00645.1 cobaltochelatase CobN [Marinobacter mobilis]SDX48586.1 cobaltochelatase CobN [Marinobacter mobilis]